MIYAINFLAVITKAIAGMVINFLAHSPLPVKKRWLTPIGKTEKDLRKIKQKLGKPYFAVFLASIAAAYVLAAAINISNLFGAERGIFISRLAYFGPFLASAAKKTLVIKKPWAFYYLNSNYSLVSLAIVGAVLKNLK